MTFYRSVCITTRVMVRLAPADTPPPAQSSMSACISSRVTVGMAQDAREPILFNKEWSFSKDLVRRIFKTFTRSTGINSSSLDNVDSTRLQLLLVQVSFFKEIMNFDIIFLLIISLLIFIFFLRIIWLVYLYLLQCFQRWHSVISCLPISLHKWVLEASPTLLVLQNLTVKVKGMRSASIIFAKAAASKVPAAGWADSSHLM